MEMRDRLRSAISSGTVSTTGKLREHGEEIDQILGTDSLDLVELAMVAEETGARLDTIGDLMQFLDRTKND